MKTAYLLRNAAWLTETERRSARRFAREVEKRHIAPGTADPVLALELYTVATAMVVFQRAQARFAEVQLAQGDPAAAFPLLRAAQDALTAATQSLRECLASRPALPYAPAPSARPAPEPAPRPALSPAPPAPAPATPIGPATAPAASGPDSTPAPALTTTRQPALRAQVPCTSPPPPGRPKIICPTVVLPLNSR